ncbi:MAG: hypothetical protein PHN82_09190 [bacterium]|nr:hypothetical protein [bacterium]
MKTGVRATALCGLAAAAVFAAGCATRINEDLVWLKTMPAFEKYGGLRRVAVVPFSEYHVTGGKKVIMGVPHRITRDNSKLIGDIFTEELKARSPYRVIEPEKVAEFFRRRDERVYGLISPREVRRVGELLKADAVIIGRVDDCSNYRYRMYNNSRVGFTARMVDPVTGEIIWRGNFRLDQEGMPHEVARRGIRLMLDQLASRMEAAGGKRERSPKGIGR